MVYPPEEGNRRDKDCLQTAPHGRSGGVHDTVLSRIRQATSVLAECPGGPGSERAAPTVLAVRSPARGRSRDPRMRRLIWLVPLLFGLATLSLKAGLGADAPAAPAAPQERLTRQQ